jgi:hypothetical protein
MHRDCHGEHCHYVPILVIIGIVSQTKTMLALMIDKCLHIVMKVFSSWSWIF